MRKTNRKTLRSWAINILLLLVAYLVIQAYQGRDTPQTGPAPTIQAKDINGKLIDLQRYQGKPVLIYFWATWCGVCGLTRSSIDGIAENHPVITIASQSGEDEAIRHYQQQHNFNVTIINDQQGTLSQRYGITAFPTIFIIDAAGHISDVEIGLSSEWGMRLRLWWAGMGDSGG